MISPNVGSRNRLLVALSPADRALINPSLEAIGLDARQILEAPSKPIRHVYFVESGLVSVIGTTPQGHRIEVGMIGYDGMTGLGVVLAAAARATRPWCSPPDRRCDSLPSRYARRWPPAKR